MKTILILGASILQMPGIQKAKELGYRVVVVDYNNEAIGIPYADEYFQISTTDKEKVCEIADFLGIDGIMTMATDMPMRTIAHVANRLKLPGISMSTALMATDKGEMIKAFKSHDIESPWYYIIQSEQEYIKVATKLTFPCIIKPTDSSGSRGVILVEDFEQLHSAYEYSKSISKSGQVIIEEYLVGQEVSVEIMVIAGNPYVLAITDKITTGAPHFVEMGHSQPSMLCSEDLAKISDLAIRATRAIKLGDGPAHVEIMNTISGPKMIEIGARMGGDNITSHLVPLSTGIDMVRATIEQAMGATPEIHPQFSKGSAIKYLDASPGTITNITGIDSALKIDGVIDVKLVKNIGDYVGSINSSTDRIGYVITQAETAEIAINICNKALRCIKIITSN